MTAILELFQWGTAARTGLAPSAGRASTIRFRGGWNAKQVQVFKGHVSYVKTVALAADGTRACPRAG